MKVSLNLSLLLQTDRRTANTMSCFSGETSDRRRADEAHEGKRTAAAGDGSSPNLKQDERERKDFLRGPQGQGEKWALNRSKEGLSLVMIQGPRGQAEVRRKADRTSCCPGEGSLPATFGGKGIQSLVGRFNVYTQFLTFR